MPIVSKRRIDFSKVFGITNEEEKVILPSDDFKGKCIDLMSTGNVPLKSENKYINTFDITPNEIQSSIEAVPLSGLSSDNEVSEELLVSVVENIKNLDSTPLQEQSNLAWNGTVDLFSVYIPQSYIKEGISSADITLEKDEYDDVPMFECEVDDDTIMLTNSTTHSMQDKIRFYRDPRAQMDNGARCSVNNMIFILRNVKYFDKSYPAPVRM